MTLHGNPQFIKEVNDWIGAHMRGGDTEYAKFLEREHYYRGLKLAELSQEHAPDRHPFTLGASGAGDCTRKPELVATGVIRHWSPGFLMTFHLGQALESTIYALIEAVGTWEIESTQSKVLIGGDYDFPLIDTASDGVIIRKDTRNRYALSGKTDDFKMSIPGYRGKPPKRKGFSALPLDGVKGNYLVQSWLECYGSTPRLDGALNFTLSKGFIPAFETEDKIMREMGSAVVWLCEVPANHLAVEQFILPTLREVQRNMVNGVVGDGRLYDKESGLYRPIDSRKSGKELGWDWDRCKWSTGECDMRKACLAAYGK